MTKEEIHVKLVSPICALEEYCRFGENYSPIVDTVSIALRHILNEIEEDFTKEKRNDKAGNGAV